MEIYTLPDFKLVFLVKNFNMAPRVLVDSGSASAARYQSPLIVKKQLNGCLEKDPKCHLIGGKILVANCLSLPCTEEENLT